MCECLYLYILTFFPGSVFLLLLHTNNAEAHVRGQLLLLPARICFCDEGSLLGKPFFSCSFFSPQGSRHKDCPPVCSADSRAFSAPTAAAAAPQPD